MAKPDPLAAALDGVTANSNSNTPRVLVLFGDRPEVLESIRKARRDRHLPWRQIARVLSTPDASISASAVQSWLNSQGID